MHIKHAYGCLYSVYLQAEFPVQFIFQINQSDSNNIKFPSILFRFTIMRGSRIGLHDEEDTWNHSKRRLYNFGRGQVKTRFSSYPSNLNQDYLVMKSYSISQTCISISVRFNASAFFLKKREVALDLQWLRRRLVMMLRNYVFSHLSDENVRSLAAVATGIVK